MADSYGSWTPYMYGYNFPVSFNDPMGAAGNPGFNAQTWRLIQQAWQETAAGQNSHWAGVNTNGYSQDYADGSGTIFRIGGW